MGDFLPIGKSDSHDNTSSNPTTTNVSTTTSTTLRDIGLTGKDAVDIMEIMGATETARASVFGNSINSYVNEVGKGVGYITDNARTTAQSEVQSAQIVSTALLEKARDAVTGENSDTVKLILLAIVGIVGIYQFNKRR